MSLQICHHSYKHGVTNSYKMKKSPKNLQTSRPKFTSDFNEKPNYQLLIIMQVNTFILQCHSFVATKSCSLIFG